MTDKSLEELLNLKYKNDLEFGSDFAMQKADLIKRQFDDRDFLQVLAFYKGSPVGYVDILLSNETVEIDELTVDEVFRNKGIGSRLQKLIPWI